jgi:hypothetical protein
MDITGFSSVSVKVTVVLFILFSLTTTVHAYPQFFTQETSRCLKCHTCENGHGFLNSYGKTFAVEKWAENKSKYYQIDLPENFNLGLRTKHQQVFYQSNYMKEARFNDLSTEIRSEAIWNQLRSYFSIDRFTPAETDITFKDYVYVSNMYLSYDINTYLNIKLGKYSLDYGFEHMNLNYSLNEFSMSAAQKGQSKNQVSVIYNQDKYDVLFSKIFNQAVYNKQYAEDGYFLKYRYYISADWLLGANFFQTTIKNNRQEDENQRLQGIIGIYKPDSVTSFFLQIDENSSSMGKKGASILFRSSYVFDQGHVFSTGVRYLNYDIELTDPKFFEFSMGYQYFPYAQINIFANYKKIVNTTANTFTDDQKSDSINLDFNFIM